MRQGVERPPCPRGHTGRVHLDAYTKNRYGTNERARYRCLPDVGPSHTFMPPMRHRHSTAAGAHECDSCERELRRVDGPSVGVKFEFTVREAAFALVRLGQGETYRGVGEEVRERAGKPIRPNSKMCKRGRTVSNEANTPLNYTDTLADVVIEELREQAWPPILIVDALPFRAHKTPEEKAAARLLYPESNKKQPPAPRPSAEPKDTVERGRILAAMGMDKPNNELPRPVLFRFMGGGDEAAWVEFFRSIPGVPHFIISDRDGAIAKAIKRAWPGATPTHYLSHWHLKMNAEEAAEKDGIGPGDPLHTQLEGVIAKPETRYDAFMAEADERHAKHLSRWLRDNRKAIFELIALRAASPGYPVGSGAVEGAIRIVKARMKGRVLSFRNAARLDRLLALMALDLGRKANEVAYARILRRWVSTHEGHVPAAWEDRRDAKGANSIASLIADAEARRQQTKTSRANAQKARRYRAKRAEYEAERKAAGLPPAPLVGKPRVARAAQGSVKGKHVSDFGWLVAEWHPTKNNDIHPADVQAGTGNAYWWKCARGDDHEWEAQVRSRTITGSGCPFCSHKRLPSPESLAVRYPDIAEQWHRTRNKDKTPADFTYASHHEAWWQCPAFRTHVWRARVSSRTSMLAGCPACARKEGKGGRPKTRKATSPAGDVIQLDEAREERTVPPAHENETG